MANNTIQLEEGKYTISLQALKKDADEASAMADYLSQVAIVTKYEQHITLTLLFQSEKTITGFQIVENDGEHLEAIEKHVDKEMERRAEAFQLSNLPVELPVRVQYEVQHEGKIFAGDEALRLVFDESSIAKTE